jgi:hypothetical protein
MKFPVVMNDAAQQAAGLYAFLFPHQNHRMSHPGLLIIEFPGGIDEYRFVASLIEHDRPVAVMKFADRIRNPL